MPAKSTHQYVLKANFNAKFHDLPLSATIVGKHDHIHGKYLTFDTAVKHAEEIQEMKLSYEADNDPTGILMTDMPEQEGEDDDDYHWSIEMKGDWRSFHVWIEKRPRPKKVSEMTPEELEEKKAWEKAVKDNPLLQSQLPPGYGLHYMGPP